MTLLSYHKPGRCRRATDAPNVKQLPEESLKTADNCYWTMGLLDYRTKL